MKTQARPKERANRQARRIVRKPRIAAEASPPPESPPSGSPFFIVGVGASAGGLEAIGKFFGSMEPDCGLAFVVVQHLSPDHQSFMVELLSQRTRIPVQRAEQGQEVHPNTIYLIPPTKHLKIQQGRLRLGDPEHDRGINLPIDVFFRSLAEEQGHRSIGVILSGTGSDGTTGVRAIKDAGGMVMVQSESTAEFAGMPRHAIGTGLADFVLAPENMGRQLVQYLQHPFVAKAQALSRDVTRRKAAEERLRENEELTRAILDAIMAHVAVVDADGDIIHVNEAWRRFAAANTPAGLPHVGFGANYFEACEKVTGQFHDDAQRCLAGLKRVLRNEQAFFEMEYPCHSSTEERWFLLHATPLPEPERGLVVAHLNITERIKAETARLELERRLQEAQRLESLGVLAGGVAHDFNNLLQSMLGNTVMARNDLRADSPARARLDQVQTAIQRASDLCRQMLAYAGKGQTPRQLVDFNSLIGDTLPLVSVSISKRARLKLELPSDLPPVHADPIQVRQVIMNLVLNASDALEDGAGHIIVRTGETRADRAYLAQTRGAPNLPEGEYVFLEVCDTGCGMSAETMAKIFDPFFTTKFIGRGLGLAAVMGILRSHQGTIRIESEVGRGSTFRVLLPKSQPPAESGKPSGADPAAWRGEGAVLVVDDEPHVGQLLDRLLRSFGFEPFLARTPQEALARLRQMEGKIKLVLLGISLAHAEGADTFHENLRARAHIPVLLMSGFGEQEAQQQALGRPVAGFVTKPFSPDALRDKLRSVLA